VFTVFTGSLFFAISAVEVPASTTLAACALASSNMAVMAFFMPSLVALRALMALTRLAKIDPRRSSP
jgi:hypothetical protein